MLATIGIALGQAPFAFGIIKLIDMGFIRFKFARSNDCFRPFDLALAVDLFTRNEVRVGDVGISVGECSCESASASPSMAGSHPHFCFRGIATLTPPQAQGFPGGHGHVLRGRPGFRTGTITRSLKWLHLVDR